MGLRRALTLAALAAAAYAGCGGDSDEDAVTEPSETTAAEGTAPATPSGGGEPALRKIGDFDQPLYVTQPPGSDDLYVVEQAGRVRLVRDGETLPDPFLDLSGEVTAAGEQGLLSLAFAPDFESSRLLYVYFTGPEEDQHVVEFRASEDGTSVDPKSRREVLRMDDFAVNHNGGLLLFGPDGHLYIGTGDGGIGDDIRRQAQDLSSLLGKLLRIDPTPTAATNTAAEHRRPYTVPADNPFVGRAGARPEVYAYGLRNPWRFSFDRETDALLIGDVGQSGLEEIDYVPADQAAGANFGWSAFEGDDRFNEDVQAPNAIPPILTYPTAEGCSVTGGYVVRDPSLPSLEGRYVYGDYCNGELRSLIPAPGGARADRSLGLEVPSLTSFGEDNAGHVYATSQEGPVFQLHE